ncbi:MAG: DUF4147 domain-containing protein [Betaproteobacteria bacterium]|nr:DUF4147 domain-containing protein [Betaproteobacteria bacterium]
MNCLAIVTTRSGGKAAAHGADCRRIEVVGAEHPPPDEAGAARHILELIPALEPDDLVICLVSGGGSGSVAGSRRLTIVRGRCTVMAGFPAATVRRSGFHFRFLEHVLSSRPVLDPPGAGCCR